jgi:hypothetical protein
MTLGTFSHMFGSEAADEMHDDLYVSAAPASVVGQDGVKEL